MKYLHRPTTLLRMCAIVFFSMSFCAISACNSGEAEEERYVAMTDNSGIPPLLQRQGALAEASEWEKTKTRVAELRGKVAANPNDVKPRLQLAIIYMAEARVTGDAYYHQSALQILDGVLKIDPKNFDALTFKASVAMSLHQFAEAQKLAEQARSINPDNAYVYGVLVDANVELGNYAQAIAMSDSMQKLKPSLESYSRASYLREIYGDYPGAKQAMLLAVQAGGAGSESAEWARVTLGDLYLNTGQPDSARMLYETALAYRPGFPNAEIGLAKVFKVGKQYDSAIAHVENAIRTVSETAYVAMLAELYALKGDKKRAAEIREEVIALLEEAEKEQRKSKDVLMQHNANRELANAYLQDGQLDKALQYAQNDLKLRPMNVDANELVGWILYLKKDYNAARPYADKMLATNTANAQTLYKAGLIYSKSGDGAKGNALMQRATATNANIDPAILIAVR